MKVTIEIKGLAHCFLKPNASEWTVSFACDNAHVLNFKHDGMSSPASLRVSGQDVFIKLGEGESDVFQQTAPSSTNTATIFNLNADYAHNGNLVQHRQKVNMDEVRMLVPYSELAGAQDSALDYFSQKQDFAGAPVVNVGKVAEKVTLGFVVNKQFNLGLFTAAGAPVGNPFTIPYTNHGSASLYFDNDCGAGCSHNDSLDLYEIFQDTNGTAKFAWGQIKPRATMIGPYRDADLMSPDYGNCDPSWSNPPVGG